MSAPGKLNGHAKEPQMAPRRYLNFDLLLEQEGEGQYQARVTESPLGETPSVRFRLPYDATTLENLLLKLDPGRSGTRRVGGTSQAQAAMDFGGPLYQAIFTGDLALAWQRSLDRARSEDAGGLRLRLRLNDAAGIAGLPWELLYDAKSNSFLAQSERTPLVRFLDVPEVPRPIAVDGPLRVLAVISSPTDLEELDVEAEWRRMTDALKARVDAGLVVLDRLPSATIGDLGQWLRRHQTHVLHFVGHGDFDERLREGVIYFQDEHGRSTPVTSSILGPYVRDHDPLRMVVLNACRSARVDGTDPFGGMAQGLVQQDATAVVAMQFPISDRAAVRFTGEFYGALVDGLPVDQAISSARKALLADFGDEWATPVLFLRSPDGNIFENVHAATVDAPAPPPPTPPHPPSPWLLWVRRHVPVVAAAAVALVALLVLAVVVLPSGGDGGEDGGPPVTALSGDQLLVAAGNDEDGLRIFVLDVTTGAEVAGPLSTAAGAKEFNPVLSPDRTSMIYSRQGAGGNQLRAAAVDGTDDRPLFDQSSLRQCSESAGRPAWIPTSNDLLMRCFGRDKFIRVVRVDVHGKFLESYAEIEPGDKTQDFGHPTVSPDGTTAVLPIAGTSKSREGRLFTIDLATHERRLLLAPFAPYVAFGDPVYSPDGTMLVWRASTDPTGGLGSEILAAPFVDGALAVDQLVHVSGDVPGDDLDPMFSPSGTQVVYTHSPVEDADTVRELWVASIPDPTDRHQVSGSAHTFYSTPAWSRR
jgi:Tol biopolymer transport system component